MLLPLLLQLFIGSFVVNRAALLDSPVVGPGSDHHVTDQVAFLVGAVVVH